MACLSLPPERTQLRLTVYSAESTIHSSCGQMEITDLEQIERHMVAKLRPSDSQRLSTWSGQLTSLSVHSPEAAEAASGVAREKSNFDLRFSKTPEGKCGPQGQPVSSFGPDKGQPSGEVRLSHGASQSHYTLAHTQPRAWGYSLNTRQKLHRQTVGGEEEGRNPRSGARPSTALPRRARAHVRVLP